MDDAEKKELQVQREKNTVAAAVNKLREQLECDPVNAPVGRSFLRQRWKAMATAITDEQARLRTVHLPLHGILMLAIDANKLAFITIRCILGSLYGTKAEEDKEPDKYTALSSKLGLHCRLEWMRTAEIEKERAIYDCGGNGKTESATNRARQRASEILKGDWRDSARDLHLGSELLALAASLGIIFIPRKKDKNGRPNGLILIKPTFGVAYSLKWREEMADLAMPFYLPMICRPNPWLSLEGGGYLTNVDEREIHLVKHWDNPKILAGLLKGEYSIVRAAVNALQEVPWRINEKVYAAMREAEKMGVRRIPKDLRNRLSPKLIVCAGLENEERFYFPYQLDFRGRAYCLPPLVNPQADDIGRSVLEFADGKPLGENGVRWLQIHLANSFGAIKGKMQERIEWVCQNSEQIRRCAGDPFGNRWWMKAHKPWRFLAASFEWDAYCIHGHQVSSHLPVTVDGTCNGFQHLSALLMNTKGATATNLMPGEQPEDFYKEVADLLRQTLEEEAKKGKAEAKDWLENVKDIDRKLAKPAVMTTPYGIGQEKISEQLQKEKFSEKLKTRELSCIYLARRLKTCIRKEFPEVKLISMWLQQIAEDFADVSTGRDARGVHWTAPSGFRVVQEKWVCHERRLKTSCGTLVLYDLDRPIELPIKEQRKGIVPNFIHSLDAAHLMLTINHLHDKGFRHFGAIHDGYTVHACDVDELQTALRKEFVEMYKKPVLRDCFSGQWKRGGAELPDPPAQGDFDIELVLDSEYFFC